MDKILQKLIKNLYFRYRVNKKCYPFIYYSVENMPPLSSHILVSEIKGKTEFPLLDYLQINKCFT